MSTPGATDPSSVTFGGNEWLVDEMYERFLQDRNSVDPAWWEFFEGYKPEDSASGTSTPPKRTPPPPTPKRATPAQPANRNPVATSTETTHGPTQDGLPAPAAQPSTAPYAASVRGLDRPEPRLARPIVPDEGPETAEMDRVDLLKGPAARVVANMSSSLGVPTATSVRGIPAKALVDNRIVINNHLARTRGGKVSFTHLIGFAVVEALGEMPEMNCAFAEADGKPEIVHPAHVNMGLAIDLEVGGQRRLLVPNVKKAETMDFAEFLAAYDDVVYKARHGKLEPDDFAGTTISLTNPGTIGTEHSVPRLMQGQGAIIGVGAMEFPAEYQGAAPVTLANLGISRVLTLTSTYDHRIIQGAQSGEFLKIVHDKLLGTDGFYDRVFRALRIPYEPTRWVQDRITDPTEELSKPARVVELIHAYRVRGHLMADIDPLSYKLRHHPDLDMSSYGLTLWDLEREFGAGNLVGGPIMTLRGILMRLRDSYCAHIGTEFMHIQDPEQRMWLQERLEMPAPKVDSKTQHRILSRLNVAEAFETFLQTKYVGQKRFSLEGAESVIPLMDSILSSATESGVEEVCIGMAHRGRLNILANLAGKSYGQIFREFQGNLDPSTVQGSGDVKYHLGTEGTYTNEDGMQTKVYLPANPSHLEAVDPVLEGIVRAKQDVIDLGGAGYPVLPILIHGDAAFAGQGVVAETLNMAELRGYRTGGTIHIIINNQLGFTTAPSSSRSTYYCTDVAKGFQVPIFHVNGDDPEACVRVAELAMAFREKFGRDVIIDMVCYRRRGHNEGDDPSMTQPLMYSLIENKRSVRKIYTESLVSRGDITVEEAEQALQEYQSVLEDAFTQTRETIEKASVDDLGTEDPEHLSTELGRPESQSEDAGVMVGWQTSVEASVLERIGQAHIHPPEGFTVHPKLQTLLEKREQMSREGGIDWGFGELLAFGSLLMEGTPIRLAGQDSRRGTFVQRHAVFHDRLTGAEWTPLLYLSGDQAKFWVYDSALSEYSALGFEYGYSVERPDALVLWEAQFGDFFNGAQTIVDCFITSAEQRWSQRASLVMLMPHGYEGQGPDHSSGRIERFLQQCAENNITVAMPSSPASYFHLLRRQAYLRPRRPLVVFTPKSMLRLKAATSSIEDFTDKTFEEVVDEPRDLKASTVDRVLLCSGKVYWDLMAALEGDEADVADRTAVIRLEQLYPLETEKVREIVRRYSNAELFWVQEEPENQGAWQFIALNLAPALDGRELKVVGRPASAATAVGSAKAHGVQQASMIRRALRR